MLAFRQLEVMVLPSVGVSKEPVMDLANMTDQQGISFRRYVLEDLRACARLAEEAWPAGSELVSESHEPWGLEGYVESSQLWSNWTEVAYDSEGIVGFLFGRIDKLLGGTSAFDSASRELSMMTRFFFGERRMTSGLLGLFWNLFLTEMKLLVNMPRSDAEIELFIVDSRHRGKGIGRMLIDRFLQAARDTGTSLVTVYTDDKTSNWQFYEKYGFRKVATFHDNLTSYFAGVDSNGIVYVLESKMGSSGNE